MQNIDLSIIPLNGLPKQIHQLVSPDSPVDQRTMVARMLIPMQPLELVSSLAFLSQDKSEEVQSSLKHSLEEIPEKILLTGLNEITCSSILNYYAHYFIRKNRILEAILKNDNTDDETVSFITTRATGNILEIIADNQVRFLRYPKIVENLYFNPSTRLATVVRVFEIAVRNNIDLGHIPAYKEICESIFGKAADVKAVPPLPDPAKMEQPPQAQSPPVPPPSWAAPPPPPSPPPPGDWLSTAETQQPSQGSFGGAWSTGAIDDNSFEQLLFMMILDEDERKDQNIDISDEERKALWNKLKEMNVAQKVRLALLGNDFARSLLIKDGRRIVYMSVLQSPKITEMEVKTFARDKSLPDEIIRTIANNKEWTRSYQIRHALVLNPKTPATLSLHYLRTLSQKDIKNLAHDKDVPGLIQRQAKQLMRSMNF